MNFINIKTAISCYNKDKVFIGAGIFTSNCIDIMIQDAKTNMYRIDFYCKESGTYSVMFKNQSILGDEYADKLVKLLIHCAKSGEVFEIKVQANEFKSLEAMGDIMHLTEIDFKGVA